MNLHEHDRMMLVARHRERERMERNYLIGAAIFAVIKWTAIGACVGLGLMLVGAL